MKELKILIAILGINLIMQSACKKDFFEREPLSEITPENYLVEESQLGAYTINLYGVLPSHSNSTTYGSFGLDRHTDNMADLQYSNIYTIDQWKVPSTGGSWAFTGIYQCNYFLQDVLPKLKEGTIAGNITNIKHYIGEAYFFRAFNYFQKLMALGDFPILKTTLPDDLAALTEASKRMPRNEVARFIISDLDSAILLMNPLSPDGKRNRLSQNVAKLMKSRVALFEATWLKYFNGTAFVPNGPDWPGADKEYNSGYTFPSGSIENEISYFLTQAMDASKEVADDITLEINNKVLQQSASDPVNPYFSMFSDVDLSLYPEILLWRAYNKGLGITHNVPVACQLGNRSIGTTRGMVDGFLMANGLPIYAGGSGYMGDDSIPLIRENRDGRLWLFLKQPGMINVIWPSSVATHPVPIEPVPGILATSYDQKYTTGYALRKGLNFDAEQDAYGYGFTGSPTFRAVEAYLNYIEACYEKNGSLDGIAQKYWQDIRTRAGVDPDFTNTTAATIVAEEAKNDWAAYSANQLVDATLYNIRRERRCELMAEGLRWMDLLRWRAMDQMITTPYHIEGFKLWGPMKDYYSADDLTYGIGDPSTVSDPSQSLYLRPYEKTPTSLVYIGYSWKMAHYLNPIAVQHFLITTSDKNDLAKSPIYQNPYWPIEANLPATN
jgi:starch-binding outer membrane protein, SusD/RagB family